MPNALPRFSRGKTDVIIAIAVPNIKAPPTPCTIRHIIRISILGENAQKNEAKVKITNPILKIFFRPTISANLPKGAKKTAADKRNEVATQLNITVLAENSFPIDGNAILVAEPIKGVTKEAKDVTTSVALSRDFSFLDFINKLLITHGTTQSRAMSICVFIIFLIIV